MLTIDTVLGADDLLERVVSLRANLHRIREARRSGGKQHELLERKLVTGMRTAVDNVESRAGHHERRLDASEISEVLVERDALLGGGRVSDGDGDTEDGVGTEFALVGGSVELDEEVVDFFLLGDFEAGLEDLGGDDVVHVGDGLEDTWIKAGYMRR